jgi:hypothetical protein
VSIITFAGVLAKQVATPINDRFSICEVGGKREGKSTPVSPHSGIAAIEFFGNDIIVVTDPNGKQAKYDLTGKEIQ